MVGALTLARTARPTVDRARTAVLQRRRERVERQGLVPRLRGRGAPTG